MRDIAWLISRLKAMEPQEVLWRVQQKGKTKKEYRKYYLLSLPVTEIPLNPDIQSLHIDVEKLSINWENSDWIPFTELDIFGSYKYNDYKKSWNAGFQTKNVWPENDYSPVINIGQRNDIGDIRTNWELNRHYQFAALAKSYYCTKDIKYLSELKDLFYDWNNRNSFLHGVEWTSAMELAIRVNSWVYTLAFLKMVGCTEEIIAELEHGILVMTDYIMKHRARFSSANNHLIVEMYAVALVGILTGYAPWKDEALKILTEELPKQNYADGVNKEMSLHYQSFVMEAYGLLFLQQIKNGISVPPVWREYLTVMSEFLADSTGEYGETIEFGDNDEGKILDLEGKVTNHYQYVLSLMSILLNKRYTDATLHENLKWVVPTELIESLYRKERYIPPLIACRKKGGYTILRSRNRKVLIGIDHAELGFGSIAAHGHADALSFQVYVNGTPFLVDAGTYNYHVPSNKRNYFRSSKAHNSVSISGTEQAEMLGPFLWGRKYKLKTLTVESDEQFIKIIAEITYSGITHRRVFTFNYINSLIIEDMVNTEREANAFLNFASAVNPEKIDTGISCPGVFIQSDASITLHPLEYSEKYNTLLKSTQAEIHMVNGRNKISIEIR